MTTLEKAAEQALDALIWTTGSTDFGKFGHAHEGALKLLFPAIEALREALEQQSKQEPVVWERELLNMLCRVHRDGGHYIAEHGIRKAIDDADLRVAKLNVTSDTSPRTEQEPKPIAWGAFRRGVGQRGELYAHCDTKESIESYMWQVHQSNDTITLGAAPLYTEPPKREWVRLDVNDYEEIRSVVPNTVNDFVFCDMIAIISAKLKELNT